MALAYAGSILAVAWDARARSRVRQAAFRRWARGTLAVLGVRVAAQGTLPTPGTLVVANHLGYLDVVVLAALMPARFVAKREVRDWPVWGMLARSVGTLFIDRGNRRDAARVVSSARLALAAGDRVVVFAEGTSTDGRGILSLRPALLEAGVQAAGGAHPVALRYLTEPGDPPAAASVCWWGEMEFLPHLRAMAALRGITAEVRFGSAPVQASDRGTLAAALHAALQRDFVPTTTR